MKRDWKEAKDRLFSTEYPRWRSLLSCAILLFLTTGMVWGWWYAYYTASDIECHRGILYFSIVWLVVQWGVIGYLCCYQNIPAFARGAINLLILLGNVWFGLFVFSLQSCGQ